MKIAEMRPDIVVPMISFDLNSIKSLVDALRGKVEHYLVCSSIWVYSRLFAIPSTEAEPPNPIGAYGVGKAESEVWLLREARLTVFPAICFRPGLICRRRLEPHQPDRQYEP